MEAAKKYNHYEINGNKIKVTFYQNDNDNKEKNDANSIIIKNKNTKLINIDLIRKNKDSTINIFKSYD